MKSIKVSALEPVNYWLRLTPNKDGVWDDTQFYFEDKKEWNDSALGSISTCRTYDAWIVYENLAQQETISCPPQNTILITGEPPSVKKYHPKFLAQFATVITCHENIKHKNKIISFPHLPWYISHSYQELVPHPSIQHLRCHSGRTEDVKTKLLSVICSNKTNTNGHRQRIRFVEILKKHFGDQVDFYGRGFIPIADKFDALAPYKYHIALENSSHPHYWTEKISDPFLTLTHPIYHGCPNINEYFSPSALTQIDITRPDEACKIIEETIAKDVYTLEALQEAKQQVLNEYNFFARMAKFCGPFVPFDTTPSASLRANGVTLYPQEYFYQNDSFLKKAFRKLKNFSSRPH